MLEINNKTSLLIPSQLPEYITGDPEYENFVLFLQAYYEWMEQNNGVLFHTQNLLNYDDIDKTTDEFLQYYINDFLPYFPDDSLLDQKTAIKVARELYQSKGTPASYNFLFKTLYNSDFDAFYTRDIVLRASAGVWYVAKAVKLSTTDTNFLSIDGYRLFGETTKSIATVEKSAINGTKIDVFISDIQRLFQSGEFVRVVDGNNQTVLFDGQPLRAKIVGQISQIKIDPAYRGFFYVPGDPVIVYNGLSSNTGIGATAAVGTTSSGSLQRINVLTGGYGYREDPNTVINITNVGTGAQLPTAVVGSLDPAIAYRANVSLLPNDSIALKQLITIGNTNYNFANIAISNANTTLINAFSFVGFSTYPISSVLVTNGGGGVSQQPTVVANSIYKTDSTSSVGNLRNIGILAPIQIANSGTGYVVNDTILFTGGSGYGAYANVTSVSGTGGIQTVEYVSGALPYPLGGMGYSLTALPTLSVTSVGGANASLYVPGILGDGATFKSEVDRVGSISTINVLTYGEDYISTPNVSLKVEDIVVSNLTFATLPSKMDFVYQGVDTNVATYTAYVDSVSLLSQDNDPTKSLYNLRVFNYTSTPNPNLFLKINGSNTLIAMANVAYSANPSIPSVYNQNGVRIYGDGKAKASATFLNGLTISEGRYLNSQGHPSGQDVLQNDVYNNFTYIVTVEQEISKYREILLNLLHPTGTKVLGRNSLRANSSLTIGATEAFNSGYPLSYYTGYAGATAHIVTDFVNKSNNIVTFENLAGANIGTFIFANSTITLNPTNGPPVISTIESVDYTSNTIVLSTNTWLTFANVAVISAANGTNSINVLALTGAYDIVNYAKYSNTAYPLMDIVYAGDKVLIANNTEKTVSTVDYVGGIIYLTSTLTANAYSYMAVNRTFSTNHVEIFGPVGTQYVPQLTTESGDILTTENNNIIILG